MSFWDKVKQNIQSGFKEGAYYVKKGVIIAKKKAKKFTKEGQRRLKLYELHSKVQKEMTELGGRIYDLTSEKKNPMLDRKVKAIMNRIENLEEKIARLEGAIKKRIKKTKRIPTAKTKKTKTPKKKSHQ